MAAEKEFRDDGLGGMVPPDGTQPDGMESDDDRDNRPLDPAFLSPDAPENRAGGEAGQAPPAAPAAPAAVDWKAMGPETADLAAKKGWKSLADMARGYAELEKLNGRHGNERDEWDRERKEMLDAVREMRTRSTPKQEPAAAPAASDEVFHDWDFFDEKAGDTYGDAFRLYTNAILPTLIEQHVAKHLGPLQEQMKPLQGMERAQNIEAAASTIAQTSPKMWGLTRERVSSILQEWEADGHEVEPPDVNVAYAYAVSEIVEKLEKGEAPASTEVTPTPKEALAKVEAGPSRDELEPPHGSTGAPAARDINDEIRRAVANSIPTVRDGLSG